MKKVNDKRCNKCFNEFDLGDVVNFFAVTEESYCDNCKRKQLKEYPNLKSEWKKAVTLKGIEKNIRFLEEMYNHFKTIDSTTSYHEGLVRGLKIAVDCIKLGNVVNVKRCNECDKEIAEGFIDKRDERCYCSPNCLHKTISIKEYERLNSDWIVYWDTF